MKSGFMIRTALVILALVIGSSCNLPFQGDAPEEPWEPEPPPEEGYRPEEPEIEPREEEPPPEEPGEAHIAFFEVNPPVIGAGGCAVVEWAVEGPADVALNGEVVDTHGAREVCPPGTSSYHLAVHSAAGLQEREVTLSVENAGGQQPPAQNQPQPQAPQQPAPKPQPTMAPLTLPGADLALTDLYADKLLNGTVYARITNHGPDTVANLQLSFSCTWAKTGYGATFGVNESAGPKNITLKSLSPGQTTPFNTGVTVDLTQFWYNMTCTIQVPFANLNTNAGNDSFTEKLAK